MKFHIKDEDGKEFEVEEVIAKKSEEDEDPIPAADDDTPSLTSEEIASLKNLAAIAGDLVALVKGKTEASDEDKDEDDDEPIADEDEEEEEEVIETDDCDSTSGMKKVGDAKSSIGKIERKSKRVEDSVEEDEVSKAWAKRYGGTR